MKIGFISHWYDPEGGAAAGPGTIARALAQRGHEVHVMTGFPNYPEGRVFAGYSIRPYQRERLRGVTVHRLPIYPSHDVQAAHRFCNYASFAASGATAAPAVLRGMDVNFVYSTPATAALPALAAQLARRTPFVVQIQDLWPQTVTSSGFLSEGKGKRVERVLHAFCDGVYRRATSVAVTSPGMAALIAERDVPWSKLHFIPNWAEEASFRPVTRDPHLAVELGLDRAVTIMYAGNLGEMQNLHHVITAAERVQDLTDLQIAFVGSGVMENSLRAAAVEKKLANVRFVPPQDFSKMSQILALGDAQVVTLKDVPLYRSTLPSKLQANLAAGRPIIGAVAGDAAGVISSSGAGRTVPPGNPEALARAIREVHGMPRPARQALGDAARNYYQDNFSEQLVADRLEELLASAAGRSAR